MKRYELDTNEGIKTMVIDYEQETATLDGIEIGYNDGINLLLDLDKSIKVNDWKMI